MALTLGVLDQSPVAEGSTGSQALHNTIDLARFCDELGFARYWVAEHHGGPMLAGAAPEVLIGPIAAATQRIRVGSGGVMLPHYSPFKVAEAFSVLAGLYPDRIDLALGRASGTDPVTTFALQRDRTKAMADDFPEQLTELLAYFEDALHAEHPFAGLPRLLPGRPHSPQRWLLGSSAQSAVWAAQLGLPYAFADFINPEGVTFVRDYRARFADGAREPRPRTLVAAWVICADTDEEAQHLAASSRMTLRLLRRGHLIPVPPPEKALRYLEMDGTKSTGPLPGRRGIIGSPATVRAGLEELAALYGTDELLVVTITYDHAARRRSYALIAEEFGLERATPATP